MGGFCQFGYSVAADQDQGHISYSGRNLDPLPLTVCESGLDLPR